MIRLTFAAALLALGPTAASAQVFPATGSSTTFDAVEGAEDVLIPTVNPPGFVRLTAKGGHGGDAFVGNNDKCQAAGGRGARVRATFPVGFGPGELEPGGTLRFLVGSAGDTGDEPSGLGFAGGGGGGGTGVLYQAPGSNAWEALVVAGGGGGAIQRAAFGICGPGQPGIDASLTTSGTAGQDGANPPGAGGTDGAGGETNGAGGGGGGLVGDAPCISGCSITTTYGGLAGSPSGAAGGFYSATLPTPDGWANGGWGCGSGGLGYGSSAGGGGGWSGGGAGGAGASPAKAGAGGGGGSGIDARALPDTTLVIDSGSERDGFAELRALPASGNGECVLPFLIADQPVQAFQETIAGDTGAGAMTPPSTPTSCDSGYGQVFSTWYAFTNELGSTRRLTITSLGAGVQMQASIWTSCAAPVACWTLTNANPGPVTYDVAGGESVLLRIATADPDVPAVVYAATIDFALLGVDADADGIVDEVDNCPVFNPDQLDADADGVGDACDLCPGSDDSFDADGDGVPDGCDLCPGADDALDLDLDGVPDDCDVCLGDDNADADGDGIPDACDPGSSPTALVDCNGNLVADELDLALGDVVTRFEDFRGSGAESYTLQGAIGIGLSSLQTLVLNSGLEGVTTSAIFEPLTPASSLEFEAEFWFRMEDLGGGGGEGFSFAALDAEVWDGSAVFGPDGPATSALAISFDNFQDAGDPDGNHIEILFDGVSSALEPLPFLLDDGAWRRAVVEQIDGSVQVRIYDAAGDLLVDVPPTFPPILPRRLRYGFGARSGAAKNLVEIDQVELRTGSFGWSPDLDGDGTLDACEGASPTIRAGTPANPVALMPGPGPGPMLGEVYRPVVDHSTFFPNALLDFWSLSFGQANVPVPGWGTSLLGSPLLLTKFVFAGVPFKLPVPNDPILLGLPLSMQALSYGTDGVTDTLLYTNALDFAITGWQAQ